MTILEGSIQGKYIVQEIRIQENILRRLEALGIIPGTRLLLMNRKKNGTSIIKVRGTRWAIGREIAEGILVKEAGGADDGAETHSETRRRDPEDERTGGERHE